MLDNYATDTHAEYVNTYCFSMATMVARTGLIVMLYVRCLASSLLSARSRAVIRLAFPVYICSLSSQMKLHLSLPLSFAPYTAVFCSPTR